MKTATQWQLKPSLLRWAKPMKMWNVMPASPWHVGLLRTPVLDLSEWGGRHHHRHHYTNWVCDFSSACKTQRIFDYRLPCKLKTTESWISLKPENGHCWGWCLCSEKSGLQYIGAKVTLHDLNKNHISNSCGLFIGYSWWKKVHQFEVHIYCICIIYIYIHTYIHTYMYIYISSIPRGI